MKLRRIKTLPNIGDILVIHGMSGFKATVESVEWSNTDMDWSIGLDWGVYGKSRVWARDENEVWYRLSTSN